MDDCALQPHDQVTSTKTGQSGTVLRTARGIIHVKLRGGGQAD